jgi:hypothetical protein
LNYFEFLPRLALSDLVSTRALKDYADATLVFADSEQTKQVLVDLDCSTIPKGHISLCSHLQPTEVKQYPMTIRPLRTDRPRWKKVWVLHCHCGQKITKYLYCTREGELGCRACLKAGSYNTRYLLYRAKRLASKMLHNQGD